MTIPTQGPTATVFNYSYAFEATAKPAHVPATIRKIVIVGGGTAGWMTAMMFANALIKKGIEIEVLESPTVGIIGVGEGSTPWLRGFFDSLGIEESEWMPACNATYKCGITFDGWSTKPGFESYFHPFASMLDNLTMTQFVHNANARANGAEVETHPNRFFIAAYLAERNLAPKPSRAFPFDVWYGYHFDAVLLGEYLHRKAVEIQKALGTPYVSFSNNLYNDAAVAMPTPIGDDIPSQTISTALKHGWRWKIPLTNRFGNGYVYSSAFCSADEAERELRESLGMLDSTTPARHLKMKIGRVTRHWNKNCLAVGLSQGFIEPLEATALLFIQRTAQHFIEFLETGDLSESAQDRFNQRVNDHFEGTRDYIVTHYKTNTRRDTEYWRANAENTNLSDSLRQLYGLWMSGKSIAPDVGRQAIGKGYPVFSWYCIMSGMGIFPDRKDLRPATAAEERYSMEEIDNLLQRSALNFGRQREVLTNIPKKVDERSLQIYFW